MSQKKWNEKLENSKKGSVCKQPLTTTFEQSERKEKVVMNQSTHDMADKQPQNNDTAAASTQPSKDTADEWSPKEQQSDEQPHDDTKDTFVFSVQPHDDIEDTSAMKEKEVACAKQSTHDMANKQTQNDTANNTAVALEQPSKDTSKQPAKAQPTKDTVFASVKPTKCTVFVPTKQTKNTSLDKPTNLLDQLEQKSFDGLAHYVSNELFAKEQPDDDTTDDDTAFDTVFAVLDVWKFLDHQLLGNLSADKPFSETNNQDSDNDNPVDLCNGHMTQSYKAN